MKYLTIWFLFLSLTLQGQYNPYTPPETPWHRIPPSVKVLTVHLTSITLNAVGDAFIVQDYNRQYAHVMRATALGLEMIGPFLIEPDMDNWWVYLASYVSLRIAIFDPIYNLSRDLPWNYRHDASYWDLAVNQFNPPAGIEVFGRSVFFIIGVTIPISELRR